MFNLLILRALREILHDLDHIKKEIQMSATRADLDAAIDTLVTTVNAAFTDLLAKIQAGTVATPEDFTAEVQKLQALTTQATSTDPGATPAA